MSLNHRYSPYEARTAFRSAAQATQSLRGVRAAAPDDLSCEDSPHIRAVDADDFVSACTSERTGVNILPNSRDTSVRHLACTNVAGNVYYSFYIIDAEGVIKLCKGALAGALSLFQRSLPRSLGFSRANSLIITDALGEKMTVHCSLIQTYDDLRWFIAFRFKGKIGEQRVKEGRYCIAHANNGIVVEGKDWEQVLEGREALVMSMLIEQVFNEDLKEACPKCGKTDLGVYIDQGWSVCRRCNTRFLPPLTATDCENGKGCTEAGEDAHFRHVCKAQVRQRQVRPQQQYQHQLMQQYLAFQKALAEGKIPQGMTPAQVVQYQQYMMNARMAAGQQQQQQQILMQQQNQQRQQ